MKLLNSISNNELGASQADSICKIVNKLIQAVEFYEIEKQLKRK